MPSVGLAAQLWQLNRWRIGLERADLRQRLSVQLTEEHLRAVGRHHKERHVLIVGLSHGRQHIEQCRTGSDTPRCGAPRSEGDTERHKAGRTFVCYRPHAQLRLAAIEIVHQRAIARTGTNHSI